LVSPTGCTAETSAFSLAKRSLSVPVMDDYGTGTRPSTDADNAGDSAAPDDHRPSAQVVSS
jgi:hypothetical protein